MTYDIQNARKQTIATVEGESNAARIFVSCPDAWIIRTPGIIHLDGLYLLEQAIPRTYENVLKLLDPKELAAFFDKRLAGSIRVSSAPVRPSHLHPRIRRQAGKSGNALSSRC